MQRESRPIVAGLWMLGSITSFTLMSVAGREVQRELDTFELMTYRSAIGFAVVAVLVAVSRPGLAQVRTRVPGLHLKRHVVHFAAQNAWFYALMAVPLSVLTALEFTYPVWVVLLAPLMLGERFTARKALVAGLGFAGVLIVARPGVAPVGWGHAAGLAAAVGFALSAIFTRRLMAHDSVLCVLFWMTATQCVLGAAIALPGGIAVPSSGLLPWLVVVGITGLTAHYSLTSALANAPATVVTPMEFVRLPVIAVVGSLVYDEPILLAVFVGGAVILAANLINLAGAARDRREGRAS